MLRRVRVRVRGRLPSGIRHVRPLLLALPFELHHVIFPRLAARSVKMNVHVFVLCNGRRWLMMLRARIQMIVCCAGNEPTGSGAAHLRRLQLGNWVTAGCAVLERGG